MHNTLIKGDREYWKKNNLRWGGLTSKFSNENGSTWIHGRCTWVWKRSSQAILNRSYSQELEWRFEKDVTIDSPKFTYQAWEGKVSFCRRWFFRIKVKKVSWKVWRYQVHRKVKNDKDWEILSLFPGILVAVWQKLVSGAWEPMFEGWMQKEEAWLGEEAEIGRRGFKDWKLGQVHHGKRTLEEAEVEVSLRQNS